VLARLDQIDGVDRSFVNRSGTLIRLSLRPGSDVEKVAEESARVLSEGDADRIPGRLAEGDAREALRAEEWRDQAQVAELSTIEVRTLALRLSLALLLLGAAVGLAVYWRRRRKAGAAARAESQAGRPR
jgi:hypothetical protein